MSWFPVFETIESYMKALNVSSKIGERENETPEEWAIRVLDILNEKFPETNYDDLIGPEAVRQRREWISTTFMVLYKIADKIGEDYEYYKEKHTYVKELMNKTRISIFNLFRSALNQGAVYEELFNLFREAVKILENYKNTGELLRFDESTSSSPKKFIINNESELLKMANSKKKFTITNQIYMSPPSKFKVTSKSRPRECPLCKTKGKIKQNERGELICTACGTVIANKQK